MFTGIITDIGEIAELEKKGDLRARINTNFATETIDVGASIACDGVCLTAIALGANWFDVQISAETISKSNFGRESRRSYGAILRVGKKVNLERSLKVGDELGGHLVSGHVDGVAEIQLIMEEGDSTRVVLEAPSNLMKFIASKGSVALNGTSLTVNEVDDTSFGVNFIPHTKSVTTWGDIEVGDAINLEIDTLARYVDRLNHHNNFG